MRHALPSETTPLWPEHERGSLHPPLDGDLTVDVAIVGAGISGLTAALLLVRAGRSVAVIEQHHVSGGETGLSTAHITTAIDAGYREIESRWSAEAARMVAEASDLAIDTIERFASEGTIDCAFRRTEAYIYTEDPSEADLLREEAEAAARAGARARFVERAPLPWSSAAAVEFERQASMNPAAYAAGLAQMVTAAGGKIFEGTRADEVHDGAPCRVVTSAGTVSAGAVVVAANVPVNNRFLINAKLGAYRTYVVGSKLDDAGPFPAMYFDTAEPYHYFRIARARDADYLIIGGADHFVGEYPDNPTPWQKLIDFAEGRFPLPNIDYRWSGQIIVPLDSLPYIGRNSFSKNVYVATGYAGQGITFGTLSGIINSDLILGKANRFAELFDATRIGPLMATDVAKHNVLHYPQHVVMDRLTGHDVAADSVDAVGRGEGKIVRAGGKKFAVYRDDDATLFAFSPICPHMACDVAWNPSERTWDCPCHGSRFSRYGKMVNGPANSDLTQVDVARLRKEEES
jgi:glycine/D-amino acid oxidase-like deaminating enzyme/nitrite reductase/ring-hydroxylating ferredoxin subunit